MTGRSPWPGTRDTPKPPVSFGKVEWFEYCKISVQGTQYLLAIHCFAKRMHLQKIAVTAVNYVLASDFYHEVRV